MKNNIIETCTEAHECLACNSKSLRIVLDLGSQPLANSYLRRPEDLEDSFPLTLNACIDCRHMQLGHIINPDMLFKNYLYVSGTTKTLRDYFKWLAQLVRQYLPKAETVLEVACNDGTQLDEFSNIGMKTFGIDPATNLHVESSKRHRIICGYLNSVSIAALKQDNYDVIVAQNVLAHTGKPLQFLKDIRNAMHDETLLFVQTSQSDMVSMGQFDTTYHEHASFFCINSMIKLIHRANMSIVKILKTEIHGGSTVFVISKNKGLMLSSDAYSDHLEFTARSSCGLDVFSERSKEIINILSDKIKKAKSNGYLVAGYGAAAKGNTVLNFGNIKLDFIVDDNQLKQGMFTPGMRIPILSPETALQQAAQKITWIILSWNFSKEIEERIKSTFTGCDNVFIKIGFE